MSAPSQLERYRTLLAQRGVTLSEGRDGALEGDGADARAAWETFVRAAAESGGELAFESAVSQASSTYVLAFLCRVDRQAIQVVIEFEATPRVNHLAFAEHGGADAERWAAEVEQLEAFALPFAAQQPLLFVAQEGRVR